MKQVRSLITLILINTLIAASVCPLAAADVYAAGGGAPGATEVALDLYGQNPKYVRHKSATDTDQDAAAKSTDTSKKQDSKSGQSAKSGSEQNAKTGKSGGSNAKSGKSGENSAKQDAKAGNSDDTDAKQDVQSNQAADAKPVFRAKARYFTEALAQKCEPAQTGFTLSEDSRFYIVSDEMPGDDLLETVSLMDSEFAAYGLPSGQVLPIVYGAEDFVKEGDIVIRLTEQSEMSHLIEKRLGGTADIDESYTLETGDSVMVTSSGTDGIYYGLLTLLEIALSERTAAAADGIVIPGMVITDGPDIAERAVMLDCGRKYFSKEWIENFIRRASMQRYNTIVLHFSEAEGLRLDSRVFPWLTEDIESYSMDEMAEIVRMASNWHVDVVPSFDSPGHNQFMVQRYAEYVGSHRDFEFKLDGKTYDRSIRGFSSIANHYSHNGKTKHADYIGIDITKEHAVAFTTALIDDYARFFRSLGCDRFDIGGDEVFGWYTVSVGGETFGYDSRWKSVEHWADYAKRVLGIRNGSASDTYINYLNTLAERLDSRGFTCRVFNDEIDLNRNQHIDLDELIDVTFWIDQGRDAAHYAEKGHKVYNLVETWCFYVLRERNGRDIMDTTYKTVNSRNIYENWDPRNFARTAAGRSTIDDEKLGGAYFAIWCDFPDYKTEAEVWDETTLRMWASGSRMWNIEVNSEQSGILSPIGYKSFGKFAETMDGFPGYTGDPSEAAQLPDPSAPEEGATWWQKLFVKIK